MTTQEAEALIQQFLHLMEARDLDAANRMIAPDAIIIFPGGKVFRSQQEMVEAAKGRYRWVKKHFSHLDSFAADNGEIVVYVLGTLYGVNNYGVEFSGVRYVDRFVLKNGIIVSQEVWNDLAESGVLHKMA
ncbi:MAG: DUF4440 domain-containing protein [Anaerolineae bacterium]|nr:DUF4440 domain-containing protein [Anaerolineae bacterium]